MGDCETVVYKRRFLPGQERAPAGSVGWCEPSVLASWVCCARVMLEIQALIHTRARKAMRPEWVGAAQLDRRTTRTADLRGRREAHGAGAKAGMRWW